MTLADPASVVGTDPILPDSGLSDALGTGQVIETIEVSLSNELVHLLSEQLYTSPLKAIEELVVNSYDADAEECRIGLLLGGVIEVEAEEGGEPDSTSNDNDPVADLPPAMIAEVPPRGVIAIYDDGDGMDVQGLRDLWMIGDSPKQRLVGPTARFARKAVGKFGIGKLATYAVANRITYLTAKSTTIHHVVCDFRRFGPNTAGSASKPVRLEVREITNLGELLKRPDFSAVLKSLDLERSQLTSGNKKTWTLCLLDALKPKAQDLKIGRLGWVLRTAMPLKSGFRVFLNGAEQRSSKEDYAPVVGFTAGELDPVRIKALNAKHNVELEACDGALIERTLFPSGITGEAIVTEATLYGKSDLLMGRSHGFFVRVRGRVVNLEDALFHNVPISYKTFNRFRADLDIDDLHDDLTAPREGVGLGRRRDVAVAVAREIALQARDRYESWETQQADQKLAPEHTRVYVAEHLVERPVADALSIHGTHGSGADVDRTWVYMQDVDPAALKQVIEQLYEKRTCYNFRHLGLGRESRLVSFNPAQAEFTLNDDHQLIKEFSDDPRSRELLDLIAAAEVMLEVYMVESGIDSFTIGQVLGRRDALLRSLAEDRVYSRAAVATMLRNNRDNDIQLELALIAAARSLGFQVKHIGGKGQPDGIARFLNSSMQETVITLEAKASQGIPSLSQLDFAGLKEHMEIENVKAAGCLLVAPGYPGGDNSESATSHRASADRISCWTVEQLAQVVEATERREITARQVADIVTNSYTPAQVERAVLQLLDSGIDMQALYVAIMDVLGRMFRRKLQPGDQRKVSQVTAILALDGKFPNINEQQVRAAVVNLVAQSRGGMSLAGDDVILFYTDLEEVGRRVASLTGELGDPRRLGTFRADHLSAG